MILYFVVVEPHARPRICIRVFHLLGIFAAELADPLDFVFERPLVRLDADDLAAIP